MIEKSAERTILYSCTVSQSCSGMFGEYLCVVSGSGLAVLGASPVDFGWIQMVVESNEDEVER